MYNRRLCLYVSYQKNNESLPCPSQASVPQAATAASASGSASAKRSERQLPPQQRRLRPVEEYPSTVQELVMNGFSLNAVVKAYDLVGNNFDDILSLLLANNTMS